ncbi:hypothetical protein EWM64_g8244 [Hericium alpestre]|uniref:Deacetylase sirtuin-type domain-containing protein n=1 Tax=Hericium alpestre TaxID=135208 RepID=A0A4Y9ZNY9_9AGAM|nr:hypothetical protein EWM64_g8244 [Hericium alpestre]
MSLADFLLSLRSEEEPPNLVLESKDISGVAKYIDSEECQNVFLMVGAGVSTAAGIPDFRSPGTGSSILPIKCEFLISSSCAGMSGLYANLARLDLPYPEAVFEIGFFRENPRPFYALAKELYPGHFRPTISHSFIKLLHEKSLLHTCFTQNIDTLERRAGVPGDKIIEAHGSFATQKCIDCQTPYDGEKIKHAVYEGTVPKCEECGGLVKPDIVFFGEPLPDSFISGVSKLKQADLLIIMGTSLTVYPFAALPRLVPDECPRILINLDEAGDIGYRSNDVVLLGPCDEIVRKLCKELGWEEELVEDWEATIESLERPAAEKVPTVEEAKVPKPVEEEVDLLAATVEKALKISEPSEAKIPERGPEIAFEPKQAEAVKVESKGEGGGVSVAEEGEVSKSVKEEEAAGVEEALKISEPSEAKGPERGTEVTSEPKQAEAAKVESKGEGGGASAADEGKPGSDVDEKQEDRSAAQAPDTPLPEKKVTSTEKV